MTFDAPAEQYDRFMGRYTPSLATKLGDAAGVVDHGRALDVGSGPGGLALELCARLGAENVAAIDPSEQFMAACRQRCPGADVRLGAAEELPWDNASFDTTLSCLAIGFFADPDRGVAEMARVTKPGGRVAACMWDIADGGMTMLRTFWDGARQIHPDVEGERARAGTSRGDIAARFEQAGLVDIVDDSLTVEVTYTDFDDLWEPLTFAIGPAGQYLASLAVDERARVRDACRAMLPSGSFSLDARAWYASGTVSG
jgi:SAM-dependent methyltransferase